MTLFAGCKYFLVPSSWLTKWRAFINATGKSKSSCTEPENLQTIIDSLICEKVSLPYLIGHKLFLKHFLYILAYTRKFYFFILLKYNGNSRDDTVIMLDSA